jgi:hypothetical protein
VPLVDVPTLLRVADRAAYQYGQMKALSATIEARGTAYYWETITATEDPDVEIPCLSRYKAVDDDLEPIRILTGTMLGGIVWGMDSHFSRKDSNGDALQLGGWDGYLQAKDERVSQYFAEMYYGTKGSYMLAVHVFSEGDDEFADVGVAAGPTIVFTDGVNYGNGSGVNPANGSYFAATQLRVVVATMGATDLDLRLTVKDVSNNLTTIDVTVPGGSVPGTVVNVGTAADRFLDVTAVDFKPAGNQGTVGDSVTVRNLKERVIAL